MVKNQIDHTKFKKDNKMSQSLTEQREQVDIDVCIEAQRSTVIIYVKLLAKKGKTLVLDIPLRTTSVHQLQHLIAERYDDLP